MATPSRAAHPVPKIETNLPPIHVDFRVSRSFDYDNDGLPDIFLVSGITLEGQDKTTSHLYRNLGNLRFEDVTAQAGLTHTGWGQGVCIGDYDNDGLRDMLVSYYGRSVLYHNEGKDVF